MYMKFQFRGNSTYMSYTCNSACLFLYKTLLSIINIVTFDALILCLVARFKIESKGVYFSALEHL